MRYGTVLSLLIIAFLDYCSSTEVRISDLIEIRRENNGEQ